MRGYSCDILEKCPDDDQWASGLVNVHVRQCIQSPSLRFDECLHFPHRLLHSYENRTGDDGKSDGYFTDVRYRFSKKRKILVVESVAGVNHQAVFMCLLSRSGQSIELEMFFLSSPCVAVVPRM